LGIFSNFSGDNDALQIPYSLDLRTRHFAIVSFDLYASLCYELNVEALGMLIKLNIIVYYLSDKFRVKSIAL